MRLRYLLDPTNVFYHSYICQVSAVKIYTVNTTQQEPCYITCEAFWAWIRLDILCRVSSVYKTIDGLLYNRGLSSRIGNFEKVHTTKYVQLTDSINILSTNMTTFLEQIQNKRKRVVYQLQHLAYLFN